MDHHAKPKLYYYIFNNHTNYANKFSVIEAYNKREAESRGAKLYGNYADIGYIRNQNEFDYKRYTERGYTMATYHKYGDDSLPPPWNLSKANFTFQRAQLNGNFARRWKALAK